MGDALLYGILLLQIVVVVLLLRRKDKAAVTAADLDARLSRTEGVLREEARAARQEQSAASGELRMEVLKSVGALGDQLGARIKEAADAQGRAADTLGSTVGSRLEGFQTAVDKQREDVTAALAAFRESVLQSLAGFGKDQQSRLDAAGSRNDERGDALRKEVVDLTKSISETLLLRVGQMNDDMGKAWAAFSAELSKLSAAQQAAMTELRTTVDGSLAALRKDNEERLEKMRQTVDEKLQSTLDQRLGESFKLVSERLESVHKGLGEMKQLASDVGSLQKVMTNVKTRGTWGEVLLGNLLEQILTPEQYESNVATTGTGERVEYAIKLPGHESTVYLPIDSKFPKEDYERLLAAQEIGDVEAAAAAGKALEAAIRSHGEDICAKYVLPPNTTDFGIMFLPSEGLYAEVLRRTETVEHLQRKCKILITGPTTLAALLNSLQMGFRTLAIQKRSSEVWELLGAVKSEFVKYADVMEKVNKKLQEASSTIDAVGVRTRSINRKLRGVEQLAPEKAVEIFPPALIEDEPEAGTDGA